MSTRASIQPRAKYFLRARTHPTRLNLKASKLNFAPRAGFAYSLTPKTVIRSGFGIFYAGIFSDLGGQVLFPGYTVEQAFNNLGTGIAQPFKLSQGLPPWPRTMCRTRRRTSRNSAPRRIR